MYIHISKRTAADFYFTEKYLGIPIVAFSDLWQEGRQLFYEQQGQQKLIKRIYNRLIFDGVDDDPQIFSNITLMSNKISMSNGFHIRIGTTV